MISSSYRQPFVFNLWKLLTWYAVLQQEEPVKPARRLVRLRTKATSFATSFASRETSWLFQAYLCRPSCPRYAVWARRVLPNVIYSGNAFIFTATFKWLPKGILEVWDALRRQDAQAFCSSQPCCTEVLYWKSSLVGRFIGFIGMVCCLNTSLRKVLWRSSLKFEELTRGTEARRGSELATIDISIFRPIWANSVNSRSFHDRKEIHDVTIRKRLKIISGNRTFKTVELLTATSCTVLKIIQHSLFLSASFGRSRKSTISKYCRRHCRHS